MRWFRGEVFTIHAFLVVHSKSVKNLKSSYEGCLGFAWGKLGMEYTNPIVGPTFPFQFGAFYCPKRESRDMN